MNIGFGSLSFSSSFPAGAWACSAARVRKSNARLAKKRFVMENLDGNAHGVPAEGKWRASARGTAVLVSERLVEKRTGVRGLIHVLLIGWRGETIVRGPRSVFFRPPAK